MDALTDNIGFLIGAAMGFACWVLGGRFARGVRRKPQRMVECAACGQELPVAKAVIIHGAVTRDRDVYATTVAEYHRRCAPGPRPDDPGAWVRHDWE